MSCEVERVELTLIKFNNDNRGLYATAAVMSLTRHKVGQHFVSGQRHHKGY